MMATTVIAAIALTVLALTWAAEEILIPKDGEVEWPAKC